MFKVANQNENKCVLLMSVAKFVLLLFFNLPICHQTVSIVTSVPHMVRCYVLFYDIANVLIWNTHPQEIRSDVDDMFNLDM